MLGQTLGHYRLLEKVGKGGMGVVYRARDTQLERDVALKVLPAGLLADQAARKRFRKEALALAKLNHPNIEAVYEFDTQDDVDFLVMEYIPGVTLDEKLAAGALPEKEVLRLGAELAQGLAAAHAEGVVHRDLKPGNLRVTPDGRLKILDFGLATLLRPGADPDVTVSLTSGLGPLGTLPYMAPEQLRGERADARTDIYAAGAVLYEMATGQRPFPETHGTRLIDSILHQAPEPPSVVNRRIPPALEAVILKALDKEPERRYQSAAELRVDLERMTAPVPLVAARRPSALPRRWGLMGAAALAIVLIALLAFNVGGLRDRLPGKGRPSPIESLAVLPLENISGDPEQEYFAEGMTDALITDLARIGALRVISRTSVMRYKGTKKPLAEIARELRVDAVVEGSVLRSGDRVRINARLIHAATDRNLWAQSYERDLRDVLAMQSEVAQAVAQEIRVAVTPREASHLANVRAVNPDAYNDYLRGRFHWNRRTRDELMKAIDFFEQAIAKDPGYAPAYAGLADCYVVLWGSAEVPFETAHPRARVAAKKALEIDETLAEAHTSLASIHLFSYEWRDAENEFRRAIELNPGYATAHHWYALYLSAVGRHEEAIQRIQRAQELDPLSLIINANVGWCLYLARQYDRTIEQSRKTLELDANFAVARGYLAQAYVEKGMLAEGIAEFQKAIALSGGEVSYRAELANAYAAAGQRSRAQELLAELKELSRQKVVSAIDIALIYAGLGDRDQAFAWLQKSFENRDARLNNLNVHPRFDVLRPDPRFAVLLRRMGLAP